MVIVPVKKEEKKFVWWLLIKMSLKFYNIGLGKQRVFFIFLLRSGGHRQNTLGRDSNTLGIELRRYFYFSLLSKT